MLWSPNGKSDYTSPIILGQPPTFSYLQFKSTSDAGIASCNVHLHHLQSLSREKLTFFFVFGKISMAYVITSGSTDGQNIFLQWKSWRIEPNQGISKPSGSLWPWLQSLLTCFASQAPRITIVDLSMQRKVFTVARHSVLLLRKTHCIRS